MASTHGGPMSWSPHDPWVVHIRLFDAVLRLQRIEKCFREIGWSLRESFFLWLPARWLAGMKWWREEGQVWGFVWSRYGQAATVVVGAVETQQAPIYFWLWVLFCALFYIHLKEKNFLLKQVDLHGLLNRLLNVTAELWPSIFKSRILM